MKKVFQLLVILLFVLQTNLFPQSPIVQQIIDSVNIDSLIFFVKELSGEVPAIINGTSQTILSRHKEQPGNALAESYIKQKLQSYGLTTTIQSYSTTGKNVFATQVGTEFPNIKYIICAHYDDMPPGTIAPGAMDNANGTSIVIEAARILSQYSFPLTIVYALWDEEEQWMVGSHYYATQTAAAGDSILGVINLDGPCYDTNNDGVVEIHNRAVGSSIRLFNKMVEINSQYGINLSIASRNPGIDASDHSSFWDFGYGAIMLSEDYENEAHPYLHTINDLIQYFNQPYYLKASKLALGTLAELALGFDIFALQSYVDKTYANKNIDSVLFQTSFLNIYNHQFSPHVIWVDTSSTEKDSLLLFDDGLHGDSLSNDRIYGNFIPPLQIENIYSLGVSTFDPQTQKYFITTDHCRFTTSGPIKLDSVRFLKGITNYYNLRPFTKNEGSTFTIINAKIRLKCDDPWVSSIAGAINLPSIDPGASVGASSWIAISYMDSIFPGYFNLKAEISIDGWTYWVDSIKINVITNVDDKIQQPLTFKLNQNYPNPFNPTTKISWQSPVSSRQTLKVYDVIGNEVATLVDEEMEAGYHSVDFDASHLPSGVYFYKLVANDFVSTKKMMLVK